jgi:pimeloyl-ACP methyl ester carboxylesterase
MTAGCPNSEPSNTVLSADGTPIRFDVRGAGEPALVFVHGWSGDRSGWRYQTEVFSRDHRVVTLDLAGFGESGNDRESWTVRRFAEDVVAVVESLEIQQAVLVGHSMGSGIVLEASLLMSDRVVGIVPVDVFQNVEERLTDEQIDRRADRLMANVNNPDRAALAAAFNNRLEPEVLDEFLASYRTSPKIGWREALVEYMRWRTTELVPALVRVDVPIVCINSGRRATDVETARRYAPAFDVRVIDGVNHAIMIEAPELFNPTLQEILEECGWAPHHSD